MSAIALPPQFDGSLVDVTAGPRQKVGAIIADPGWLYGQFRDSANGAAKAVMQTRGLSNICRIRAGQRWAADECVLVLWGTGPKIDEAVFVERAWGFEHKTMVPWLKCAPDMRSFAKGGIGIWVRGMAEYVLFGTRGDVGDFYTVGEKDERGKRKFTRLRPRPQGLLVGPREYPVFWDPEINEDPDYWNSLTAEVLLAPGEKGGRKGEVNHSKKPLALYAYLETFPGPYLELYARANPIASFDEERRSWWTRVGWEVGHELGPWGARSRGFF